MLSAARNAGFVSEWFIKICQMTMNGCCKNLSKCSKAMESDMALEMLQQLKSKGFYVKKLVMDNETTSISR